MLKRVLCALVLLVLSESVYAQNLNDLVRMFGGIIQQGMIQAAQSQWRRMPPNELSCLDQALREQGVSIDALVSRGITPSHPWLSQLQANCRGQSPQPSDAQPSPYAVDGLPLGGQVLFDSQAYKKYHCAPSEKFPGFTWCHKEETKRENRIEITFSSSQ